MSSRELPTEAPKRAGVQMELGVEGLSSLESRLFSAAKKRPAVVLHWGCSSPPQLFPAAPFLPRVTEDLLVPGTVPVSSCMN